MNKFFIFTFIIFNLTQLSLAKDFEKDDFKTLMSNYLSALKNKDEKALSKVTTKRFLEKFKKDGQLERIFKAQDSTKIGKFDITFKRAIVNKDLYMVNIKNPEDKSFDEDWYFVKADGEKLLLDEMHNLK